MPNGWQGKILHVNLTSGELEIEEPPEEFYRFYMGGSAMALHYVLKNTPAHADPLGPENTLALAAGVVTGAAVSGQSRATAVAKSPLSGVIGDSQSGGFWPAELKFAGFDGIVIYGQSPKPVYLWLHDADIAVGTGSEGPVAELRDASHLWGKNTGDVENILKEELDDPRIEVLQVGPAGEKGVRFAAMISMSNRANGRTGMGAVMGSKKLKAIVVRGKDKPDIADPDGLKELARWGSKNFPDSDIFGMGKYGTAEVVLPQNKAGGLPTYNWNSGHFEDAEAISGEEMYDTILRGAPEGKQNRLGRDTCYACTVRCKRVVDFQEDLFTVNHHYGGPEYETISTFGSYCGVEDLKAIAYANQLCNQYGMDTISCGATIAWAFDCFEQGLLTAEDTNGLELGFGNAEAMVKLTEMIAKREGFGDILAEGSARAAEHIGRGTEDLVVATKKHEMPAHMPQVKRSLGLIYAVNPFGADHQSSEHDGAYEGDFEWYGERLAPLGLTEQQDKYSLTAEKVRYALITEYLYSCLDSVSVCQFVFGPSWHLYGPDQLVELVQTVSGWDVTVEELLLVGERRLNMLRAFNAREGLTRKDDVLPKKMYKALTGGPSDGFKLTPQELETAKDTYYELAGWDPVTGNPTPEKLSELGLSWIIDEK